MPIVRFRVEKDTCRRQGGMRDLYETCAVDRFASWVPVRLRSSQRICPRTAPRVPHSPSVKRQRPIAINAPGHAHELTFSCYRRLPLLADERALHLLADAISAARETWRFTVWAYVFMPEHVHILIHPSAPRYGIGLIRKAIKQPVASRYIRRLRETA